MIKNIIVHHTSGTDSNPLQSSKHYTLKQCNSDHKLRFGMLSKLGWYVGYHYFIDINGIVTQCRLDTEEGAHCKGYNNTAYDKYNYPEKLSIGICLAGNFDVEMPSKAQIDSFKKLLISKMKEYNINTKNIVPHRKYANKTCNGNLLSDSWARDLLNTPPVSVYIDTTETFAQKWHKLMIQSGFIIKDGKYVWNKK